MNKVLLDIRHCEFAVGFFARARGLLGRHSLSPELRLVLAPCKAIHTTGMRFPIDLLFFSRTGEVLAVYEHVSAGRVCMCWRAHGVIEAAAGWISREGIQGGDQIEWGTARFRGVSSSSHVSRVV